MSRPTITYVSDNAKGYVDGLKQAQTEADLRAFLKSQAFLAADAYKVISGPSFNWDEFAKGRKIENSGEYAGDEYAAKYGAIMMPEMLIRVGIIAERFGAPWGCAYIRCVEKGLIKETKTEAKWVKE